MCAGCCCSLVCCHITWISLRSHCLLLFPNFPLPLTYNDTGECICTYRWSKILSLLKTIFPDEVIVMGSRDEDLVSLGPFLAYCRWGLGCHPPPEKPLRSTFSSVSSELVSGKRHTQRNKKPHLGWFPRAIEIIKEL